MRFTGAYIGSKAYTLVGLQAGRSNLKADDDAVGQKRICAP